MTNSKFITKKNHWIQKGDKQGNTKSFPSIKGNIFNLSKLYQKTN